VVQTPTPTSTSSPTLPSSCIFPFLTTDHSPHPTHPETGHQSSLGKQVLCSSLVLSPPQFLFANSGAPSTVCATDHNNLISRFPYKSSIKMSDNGQQSPNGPATEAPAAGSGEHLNIKVTDGNNEVFFKIKRSTKLEKLMKAFCERQGKDPRAARFLFEGQKVQPTDTPDQVSLHKQPLCTQLTNSIA